MVLQAYHQGLRSWSGTITEPKGAKSEQKSSVSPMMMPSTDKQCPPQTSELPDIHLKVEGNAVQELQSGHLKLLLEDKVPELKGMEMFIHTTEQKDTVLVKISQAGKS